ncbi:hypothetical protein BDV59DRAFT_103544 [Aspergillus ambiguus]|uniref:uncharacterized protein n=1 Tax=Aspergillus ambiguus TaxID=176160 RepID=UPI003CCDCAD9
MGWEIRASNEIVLRLFGTRILAPSATLIQPYLTCRVSPTCRRVQFRLYFGLPLPPRSDSAFPYPTLLSLCSTFPLILPDVTTSDRQTLLVAGRPRD